MKRIVALFSVLIYGMIGTFLGTSLFLCMDYSKHPELYNVANSAPWYTRILSNGLVTLVIVTVLGAIRYMLARKMRASK